MTPWDSILRPSAPQTIVPQPIRSRAGATVLALSVVIAAVGFVLLSGGQAAGQTETTTPEQPAEQGDGAVISGTLSLQEGDPVAAVKVSLFTANPDRTPDQFLRPAFTGSDGRFVFDNLAADCYIVQTDAPPGTSFDDGTEQRQVHSCVDPGQTDDSAGAILIAADEEAPFRLHLIHVGDHHSAFKPSSLELEIDGITTTVEVGGVARLAAKTGELRSVLGAEPLLTIHSGGALGGTPFFSIFRGAADATVMNDICFDLFALGSQDLSLGHADAQLFLDFLASAECRTEVLAPEQGVDVSLVRQQSTDDRSLEIRRFGDNLVGLATIDPPPSTTAAVDSLDEEALSALATSAQEQIDRLVDAGVRNVVLITEIGFPNDVALAAKLTDVDAIIGGGSHSLLGDFSDLGLLSEGSYPTVAANRTGTPVCIGHAWRDAKVVGEMNLVFDDAGRLTECGGIAHLLNGDGPGAVLPDPSMAAAVKAYELALGSLANEPIGDNRERFCMIGVPGRTVGLLCGPDVAGDSTIRPSDVQRLIADSLRTRIDGADMAIINSGATEGGIPAGAVTVDRTYRLLPNDDKLAVLEMTGAEIVSTLEEAIEAAVGPDGSPEAYPHATGLRWLANLSAPSGERATEVLVRPPNSADWEVIDPVGVYLVATIDSLATGGNGYATMAAVSADGRATVTPTDYAQAFIDYVEQDLLGVVSPFRSDRLN